MTENARIAQLQPPADRSRWTGDDDLVFVGVLGSYLDGSALRRRYDVSVKAAGIRPLRFHDLRHTFGTRMIAKADIRQGTTDLGQTNDGGNTVISPYPGKDAKLLICADGYDQKEVTIHGVAGTFEITPGTNACPPLPTPSPSPSPAPSDSTPSASPGASPSPTASP